MTFYKNYEYSLLDRMDLKTSVYIAALDIQYCCDLPYLWCFCFDLTGEVIFGRNWEQLNEFFEMLEKFGFDYDHRLYVYLDDLSKFFCYSKKYIDYDEEMTAKSPSQILHLTCKGLIFRDFQMYFEKTIDDHIYLSDINAKNYHIEPDAENLSERCELTDQELDYCSRRVLEISAAMRREIDMVYQGDVSSVRLTRTQRIESIISHNMKLCDEDKQLYWLIYSMNPVSTDWGRDVLLPQLRKAFFGGTTFLEEKYLNVLLKDVWSADLISAYCGEFFLSKFPMSRFKVLTVPGSYKDIFKDPYYNKKALLITFEATNVRLKRGALAVLPSAMRHYYINLDSKDEKKDAIQRAQGLKLNRSKIIRMTLTDIDFELFCSSYEFDDIKVLGLLGARYGYLPDYILLTVAELYKNKLSAKNVKRELEKIGLLDDLQEAVYNESKSSIARLYGIFTKSPVVCQYRYNKEKRDIELLSSNYLLEKHRFRPVVYQWGVWTVSHVRKKLCSLRDELRGCKCRTISGDTDCVNFMGDATNIISDFNKKVNAQVKKRCEAVGIDPNDLKELGTLEVKKYKFYRITGLKQYAVVRETENGDVFEPICGGMDKENMKKYFQGYDPDPKKQIDHFRLGLTIPAEDKPRKLRRQCSIKKHVDYIDREGNRISSDVPSYQVTEYKRFIACDIFSAMAQDEDFKQKEHDTYDIVKGETAALLSKAATKTPKKGVKKKK